MDDGDAAHHSNPGEISSPAAQDVTLGIVVASYAPERLEDILRLLESIEGQISPIDEVVVVVQQSRELLASVSQALARLTRSQTSLLFLEVASGVSQARNAGLRTLKTDVIAFVDDDAVLTDDWALATRRFYSGRADAVGVAGAILPLWDSPAMEWFPHELYWMLSCTYWTWTSPMPVRNGYGANISFRQVAFEDGREFNESFGISGWGQAGWHGIGGEEPELSVRVTAATGQPILYVPDIRVWHRVEPYRLQWRSMVRRAYWGGRTKAALSRDPTLPPSLLDTERDLVPEMARAQVERVRVLGAHPLVALRQEGAVLLVVAVFALGLVDGRFRRHRPGRAGGEAGEKGR